MREYYVYILRCADESLYTGVTNNLSLRIFQHVEGVNKSSYTFKRRPLKLVYSAEFHDIHEAISWEKTIKRWSRKKKEALICGDQKLLQQLAQNAILRAIHEIHEMTKKGVMVSTDEP